MSNVTTGTTPKLALVTETRLAGDFCEYALKLAVRLDLDIIVLFVGPMDSDPAMTTAELEQRIEEEAAAFTARAWNESVQVTTVVDRADQDTALQKLRQDNPDIRFVLTSLNEKSVNKHQAGERRHRLTVIRQ